MSDDLISRKDFITEMEINIGNIYNPDIIKGMKFAIDLINSRPTAFDKEKVIEQLHRCRVYQFQGTLPDGRVCHFSDVIEIVEKGGIE